MAKNDDGHQVISGDDDVMSTEKQMIVEKCNNSARTLQNVPPKKRWTSALRVVTAMARFKHMSKHQHHDGGDGTGMNAQTGTSRTASSSFSGSNESMPTNSGSRNGEAATEQESESNIDPVYLALKQATEKYGSRGASNSRRSSQLIAAGESTTPSSTRNLSQASLLDSGTFSCSGEVCGGYGGSTTMQQLRELQWHFALASLQMKFEHSA
uniref:Uncharacterized protein n=1 Tax=Globodera pallida TaxID=36090 RepID=A0A183CCT0_GLOPA